MRVENLLNAYATQSGADWTKLIGRAALEAVPGGGVISVLSEPALRSGEVDESEPRQGTVVCGGTLDLSSGAFDGHGVSSVTDMGLGLYHLSLSSVTLLPYHVSAHAGDLAVSISNEEPGGFIVKALQEVGVAPSKSLVKVLCLKL